MDKAIEHLRHQAEAVRNRLADPEDEAFKAPHRDAERVWQANSAEILPTDDGGFVVVLRLWDQTATRVARDPGELRRVLDEVEWKRTEATAHHVPRPRRQTASAPQAEMPGPGAAVFAGGSVGSR